MNPPAEQASKIGDLPPPPAGLLPASTPALVQPANAAAPAVAPSRRRPSWLLRIGTIVGLVLLWQGGMGLWYRWTGPEIPAPALEGVDVEIVRAIRFRRDAIVRRPGSAQAWGELGKVLRIHEYEAESQVCFERAAELNPREPRWHYYLAKGLRSTNPDRAVAELERAVELNGDVQSPRQMLAELYLEAGRTDDAEHLAREVLARVSSDARSLQLLGQIALLRNQWEAARHLLRQSAELAPIVKATHSLLARVESRLGNAELAAQAQQAMIGLSEEFQWSDPYQDEVSAAWVGQKARLTHASSLWSKDNREQSIAVLRDLVRDYPTSLKPTFLLGEKLNQLKRHAEAEPYLRTALQLDDEFPQSHFELAFSLHRRHQVREAAEHYRRAVELRSDYAMAHFGLGLCQEALGDIPAAIEELQFAVRFHPDVAVAHRQLGKLLLATGQFAEARASLNNAASINPGDEQTRKLLDTLDAAAPATPPTP